MTTRNITIIIVAALIIGVGGGIAYHMYRARSAGGDAQAQTSALLKAVGKLMILPDEEPVVATVQDPTKLQNQPMFKTAKAGDKILVFQNAKKAVIYDPAQNRIVDIVTLVLPLTPTPTP